MLIRQWVSTMQLNIFFIERFYKSNTVNLQMKLLTVHLQNPVVRLLKAASLLSHHLVESLIVQVESLHHPVLYVFSTLGDVQYIGETSGVHGGDIMRYQDKPPQTKTP